MSRKRIPTQFTGFRLDVDIRRDVEKVCKWSRRDLSEILRECIHAHLPVLKDRYCRKPDMAGVAGGVRA